jgi:hypothetical protein
MRAYTLVVGAITMLSGCGPAFLPEPASRPVTTNELVGTWQYTADYGKTLIQLTIRPDGTFQQTVTPTGSTKTLSQSGRWTLDERNHIRFDALLTHEGYSASKGWTPEEVHWWVTDGIGKQPAVVLFGGTHPDPDSWQRFEKIR